MNINPNLSQARKYEFYAMQADLQGHKDISERYKFLSKMSLIDAASYSYNASKNRNTYIKNSNIDLTDESVSTAICGLIGVSIVVLCCIF